ncbi:MAG: hypothetical protein K6B44_11295 [Lachnospiraceae bacterium]|nr:hypothetical protein [Lachnospiraceae bacterium]
MSDFGNVKSDIDFRMDKADVSRITEDDLKGIRQMIREFARTKQNLEEEGSRNTWKNNSVPETDRDKKQDVSAIVDSVIETLEGYFRKAAAYREKVPFSLDLAPADFPAVIEFMHFCKNSVGFPANWVASDDLKIFFYTAEEQKERKLNKIEYLARVITHMGEDFLNQNADEKSRRIEAILKKVQGEMSQDYTDEKRLLDGIDAIMDLLEKAGDRMKAELDILNKLTDPLCVAIPRNMDDVEKIAVLAGDCSMELKASEYWFSDNWVYEREKSMEKAAEAVRKIAHAKAIVLEEYDKAVLDVDYAGIMARMDNEYTSFLRMITPQFKADMNAIRVHRRQSTKKITYEEMIDILEKIKKYRDAVSELEVNSAEYLANMGGWYNGEYTDFESARAVMGRFDRIKAFYRGNIPSGIKAEIISGKNVGKYSTEARGLGELVKDPSIAGFRQIVARSDRAVSENIETAERLGLLLEALKKELTDLLREFYSKETLFNCYDSLISLSKLQSIESLDQRDEASLKEMYGEMFKGGATDWKTIISKLGWVKEYVAKRKVVKTNEAFDKGVASAGEFVQTTDEIAGFLEAFIRDETEKIEAFDKLFSGNEDPAKKRLSAKLEKAKSYKESIKKFDVRSAFNNAIDRFFDMGLGDFVNKVLQSELKPEEYEGAFVTGFERLRAEAEKPEIVAAPEEAVAESVGAAEAEMPEAAAAAEPAAYEPAAKAGFADAFGIFKEFIYEKAAKGKTSKDELLAKVTEGLAGIAAAQSPVHIDIVCRQLAPLYGYVKVTPKVKEEVTGIIEAQTDGAYSLKDDYLWSADTAAVVPKLPEEGAKPRPLDKIAPEELAAAMTIIETRDSLTKKDELFKAVAKEFACNKLTAALKKQLEQAYNMK